MSFYAASKLVLSGHAASVYDVAKHRAVETSVFGRSTDYVAFFYPPLFLLICAPLAVLPYLAALAAWLGATGAAFFATARSWLGRGFGWTPILAFPAVLSNIGHGQNAFLSAALLGTGTRWLGRRPYASGVAIGLLAFKPHLGLLLPVAMVASGHWKALASASATVIASVGLTIALFGWATWQGFLAVSPLARDTLDLGLVDPGKMVSLFAAFRVLGAPLGVAYAAQGVLTVLVAALLLRLGRRLGSAEVPVIVIAALLGSPFLLDYDLVILGLPLAWLANQGIEHGFRPWEKLVLLCGFVLPLAARPLAMELHIPLAPFVMAGLLASILARALADNPAGQLHAQPIKTASRIIES